MLITTMFCFGPLGGVLCSPSALADFVFLRGPREKKGQVQGACSRPSKEEGRPKDRGASSLLVNVSDAADKVALGK